MDIENNNKHQGDDQKFKLDLSKLTPTVFNRKQDMSANRSS